MDKLISRNPIQRFKEGKQIQKMQGGGPWSPENRNKIYNSHNVSAQARYNKRASKDPEYHYNSVVPIWQRVNNTPQSGGSFNQIVTKVNNIFKGTGNTQPKKRVTPTTTKASVRPKSTQPKVVKQPDSQLQQVKEAVKFTPGIINNNGFTPTQEATTDINTAKQYLSQPTVTTQETLTPGTFNRNYTYNTGNIRSNRGINYSNVEDYWNYLNNNKDSDDFKLFSNIMRTTDGNLNREAFDQIMSQYGISGNLGRRDSGRLANLLNDLNLIGTEGSEARNSFIDSYNKNFINQKALNEGQKAISNSIPKLNVPTTILPTYYNTSNNYDSSTLFAKQGGQLPSKNPIKRFKEGNKIIFAQQGISFKQAHAKARANKQRYFNWTDAKGITRMYNSKAAGNDTEYESFVDNMNEMSSQLPTDRQPKHLGWDRNNPTSSELRGKDRQIREQGTESTLPEITITGKAPQKIFNRIRIGNKLYSRGIAQSFPGYMNNKDGLYLKGNKIYKRSLQNGKYIDQEVGVMHKGQQYYDESLYGRKNGRFTTSTDNDNVVTYDEYRNRLNTATRNKFMGNEALGGSNIVPKELPYTKDMNNVEWFRNYKFKK